MFHQIEDFRTTPRRIGEFCREEARQTGVKEDITGKQEQQREKKIGQCQPDKGDKGDEVICE